MFSGIQFCSIGVVKHTTEFEENWTVPSRQQMLVELDNGIFISMIRGWRGAPALQCPRYSHSVEDVDVEVLVFIEKGENRIDVADVMGYVNKDECIALVYDLSVLKADDDMLDKATSVVYKVDEWASKRRYGF